MTASSPSNHAAGCDPSVVCPADRQPSLALPSTRGGGGVAGRRSAGEMGAAVFCSVVAAFWFSTISQHSFARSVRDARLGISDEAKTDGLASASAVRHPADHTPARCPRVRGAVPVVSRFIVLVLTQLMQNNLSIWRAVRRYSKLANRLMARPKTADPARPVDRLTSSPVRHRKYHRPYHSGVC